MCLRFFYPFSRWSFVVSLFINCFLLSFGHNHDLHSFPTRRSSDLATPRSMCGGRSAGPCCARPWRCATRRRCPKKTSSPPRSEEHTSELQSLRHLVCRLLLEKKKATPCLFSYGSTPRPTVK